ncbi:MAG: hypothetical protein IJP74_12895 [Prevotella sp.]|nr:hypothetical protein [Prevotella sp.]
MVAYLKAGFSMVSFHQPFRHTYGMAVWLATPIMPLWGIRLRMEIFHEV